MKKKILVLLVAITMGVSVVAQKFEVIREYPFDDFLQYYEEWPDDDGYEAPGITNMVNIAGDIYIYIENKNEWVKADKTEYKQTSLKEVGIHTQTEEVMYVKEKNKRLKIYINKIDFGSPSYILDLEPNTYYKGSKCVYFTEGMVFAQTNNDKLVSWKLLGEGKSEYYNAEKTEELLEEGLAEKVGLTTNARRTNFFFGEFNATSGSGPNYINIMNDLTIKTEKYSSFNGLSSFHDIGTDKNGISYFYRFKYNGKKYALDDPDNPIIVLIGILDPWEKEVNVIELPAGDWDPERRAGGLIARCSQCIDEEGNVYFTDCSKEKGVYQIKKLTNTWSKELGYSERKIGRMSANRIPLYEKKDTSSENNGYNYEHEYLWVLESGEKWSKVRKVDGREGYVETRYIRFN